MANLPRAVQRQVDEAEALLASSNPPADGAVQQQQAQPPGPAPEQAAAQVQPPIVAAETPPTPDATPKDDVWERKYKTLQGLFNAEIPKLQRQNQDLSGQLRDAIARMDKQAEGKKEAPEQAAVDPRDAETFGSDLVEMVQRQVQLVMGSVAQKLDSVVGSFEARLGQVEQALKGTTQTVAVTAEEMFFNKLAHSVPDWEQVNANDAFLAWLSEVDAVYGQPRQAALTAAQQSLDVQRVAAVFNAFKATLPKGPAASAPLAKQVSPRSTSAAPPAPTEKPVISELEITQFYKEVATGKYRGREAEAHKLEQIINEAIAESRVR